ncbi:hypothetical protein LTR85_010970 [Meristemomyces frigidus]|nr:hypothetical protein LTR85_010970 [Meristemomyces frigidus]
MEGPSRSTDHTEALGFQKYAGVGPPTSYPQQKVFRWSTAGEPDWDWSTVGDTDSYVAISHTWRIAGKRSELFETVIAGEKVDVSVWKRDNLAQWIKRVLRDRWVWMDVMCIPQSGDKSVIRACLQCIPQIFNGAECVHVLLEDQAPLPNLPTYEELDKSYAREDRAYNAAPLSARRLPVMRLVKEWFSVNNFDVPDLAWMQRFWTRQEAQYASRIRFHGVGLTRDNIVPHQQVRIETLGPIGQLSSSMVTSKDDVMCTLFIELAAARGVEVAGLEGRVRQRNGGLVMALRELRAARRVSTKSKDYVFALFPTFGWYVVPELARAYLTLELLGDALRQFERSEGQVVLRSTMDGIFPPALARSPTGQASNFEDPHSSYDFFSTMTTIGHCQRQADGSVNLIATGPAELVEWVSAADRATWTATLSAVCIDQAVQIHQERHFAMEALEKECGISGDEQWALREFVITRNVTPLAALEDRRMVIAWITCIHLVLTYRELDRITRDGAQLMLTKAAGLTVLHPAIIGSS